MSGQGTHWNAERISLLQLYRRYITNAILNSEEVPLQSVTSSSDSRPWLPTLEATIATVEDDTGSVTGSAAPSSPLKLVPRRGNSVSDLSQCSSDEEPVNEDKD